MSGLDGATVFRYFRLRHADAICGDCGGTIANGTLVCRILRPDSRGIYDVHTKHAGFCDTSDYAAGSRARSRNIRFKGK